MHFKMETKSSKTNQILITVAIDLLRQTRKENRPWNSKQKHTVSDNNVPKLAIIAEPELMIQVEITWTDRRDNLKPSFKKLLDAAHMKERWDLTYCNVTCSTPNRRTLIDISSPGRSECVHWVSKFGSFRCIIDRLDIKIVIQDC